MSSVESAVDVKRLDLSEVGLVNGHLCWLWRLWLFIPQRQPTKTSRAAMGLIHEIP